MFRCNAKLPSLHAFLVVFLCLCAYLQPTALAIPLQGKEISISVKKSSLPKILYEISEKSGITIFFVNEDISMYKDITYEAKNKEVKNILAELLKDKGLQFEIISEKQIGIRKIKPKAIGSEDGSEELRDTLVTVSGTVTNEKGEPLPGASVVVKNSAKGTITDNNGAFSLKEVPANATIIVSNVSYETTQVNVRNKRSLGLIGLKQSISLIDETIVIAYGETTRRINPGNTVRVKSDEIEKQPVSNPLYALQGRVAGLEIAPTSGLPGAPVGIQIRGRNSLNFQSDPLIVIDGLPVVNNITGLGHENLQNMSALSFLNPNEIESIDVLKDADATSIYGSRGANGVILITTKKGKAGETKVDLNVQTGWAKVTRKMPLLNTEQYLEMRKEAYSNSGIDIATLNPSRTNSDVTYWDENRQTDWQDKLLGGTGKYYDFQGSVSGGSNTIQYLLGGNFHRETTIFDGSLDDKKGSVHMSLRGASSNQKFKASLSASYLSDRNRLPGVDFTLKALTLPPNAPALTLPDGSLNWELLPSGARSWDNPYSELFHTYDARTNNLVASSELSYSPSKALQIKTTLGYNELRGNSFRPYANFAGRPPDDLGDVAGAGFNTNSVKNISVEPQLNYTLGIGKGVLSFLLGASYQSTNKEDQLIDAFGATSDALLKNLSSATTTFILNSSSQYKYAAVFGRMNFIWDNRYILNITARRDGSSRFGPGKQFGNFASIAGAWIFTEEQFIKDNASFLSFGKLRLSYGTSGNDGIGDYSYLEKYETINVGDNYQGAKAYQTTGIFNSYYHWETTRKMEFGFESGFFRDKVLLGLSYYKNRSGNQLSGAPYPTMAGPGSAIVNLPALVENNGFEATINTRIIDGNGFNWSASFNYSRNRNKLISYPELEKSIYYGIFEIGQPFYGQAFTYKSAGVDKTTGRYLFEKADGTITFDPYDPNSPDGGRFQKIFTTPKFYGGLTNTVSYKGLSLNFTFQFSKQTGTNPLQQFFNTVGRASNLPSEYLNRWRKEGDDTKLQKIFFRTPDEYRTSADYLQQSDFNYVDASFIRLKNIHLAYLLPVKLRSLVRVKALRVYIQAQNVLTFTSYKGLDPETGSAGLPPLKIITTGIQATF